MKSSDRFWQRLIHSVGGIDSSRRLALGVTLGMLIGLVPKESLFPYLIGLLLILSPANLFSGFVSAGLFSILSNLQPLNTLFDRVGIFLLSNDWTISSVVFFYQYPLLPWMRLENSIVAGAILFGLMVSLPLYLLSEKWFDLQGIKLIKKLLQLQFFRRLTGARNSSIKEDRGQSLA